MAEVSRLKLDHPALDDPGGNALHTQVEGLYIKIGNSLSARYFEGIAVANGATVIFDHNFKMPFDELAFKVYLLAGAGGELTVTTESDYAIVATPGNLTTQISVTNNSGGVSTFAVLIQSLGGAGGGGQTLYDVVVDAAGGGDYVNLKTAYDTEPAGTTIYIRNGSYSVSAFITIKPGTKVIGESRNGVVIEYTGSNWGLFRAEFGAYRGGTERVANNTAWDTTSIGTISATNGTNILVYTGATNPVAGDLIHVEPNFYALISSVDTGLKEITIDRNWGNDTASGLDCMVLDTIVTDTEARSEFSNFTCVLNNGGQTSLVRSFNSMYNCHFSNIKLYAEAVGAGAFLVFLQATLRCSLDDIEIDANDTSTTKAFLIFNGISDLHVRNLIAYNIPGSAVQLGGGVKAIRRSTLHFKSLSCEQYALASETGIYRSLLKIDNILAARICTGGSGTATFFESKITVERASLSETFTKFDSAKSIHSVNYVNNSVQVTNPVGGSTLHNIITDSYIDGTLTVDSEAVISGSVAYDAISGVPAQNNGFEF